VGDGFQDQQIDSSSNSQAKEDPPLYMGYTHEEFAQLEPTGGYYMMEFAIYFLIFVFIANRMYIQFSHQRDSEKYAKFEDDEKVDDSLFGSGLSKASQMALDAITGNLPLVSEE
jgi:hypothetical protein